jgi:dTDP-4-amino-4,6-dideoxygalactose transaminase
MDVPVLDLKAQNTRIKDEIGPALERVIESQSFILGPEVETPEQEIAVYSGTKFAIGISSGSDGLVVALMALDVEPGAEIITTPFTFFGTAGVIARLRAIPAFADINPLTFNINPDRLELAITSKTKAIIPVHLFG